MVSRNAPATIVYIDDDPNMIELVRVTLEKEGYAVVGVVGGMNALATITKTQPDLVMLDLMMPEVDGWEIYQSMRADETLKNIPVIVLTAKSQNIDKVLGLHIAKVNDYITKPFVISELLDRVRRVLGDRRS